MVSLSNEYTERVQTPAKRFRILLASPTLIKISGFGGFGSGPVGSIPGLVSTRFCADGVIDDGMEEV